MIINLDKLTQFLAALLGLCTMYTNQQRVKILNLVPQSNPTRMPFQPIHITEIYKQIQLRDVGAKWERDIEAMETWCQRTYRYKCGNKVWKEGLPNQISSQNRTFFPLPTLKDKNLEKRRRIWEKFPSRHNRIPPVNFNGQPLIYSVW